MLKKKPYESCNKRVEFYTGGTVILKTVENAWIIVENLLELRGKTLLI
jgi:hypothetical protein